MCPTYGHNEKGKKAPVSNSTTSTEEQLRISSSQIDQRENARLVEQLKEVIKMNTHWQRYDSQREEYVLKLTRTNQELQSKISDLQHRLEEVNLTKDTETKTNKPKVGETLPAAENEDNDEGELKALRKEEEVAVLTDRIATLKDKVVKLEKGRESRKKDDDDQLGLLRAQVNICVEDFTQERKDRERIHGENERLRERLAVTERRIMENEEQMFVYKEQIKELQGRYHHQPESKYGARKGYDQPCCYPEDRPLRHRAQVQTRNAYRHPMYFGDDLTDLPRDVEIDGVPDESYDETDSVPKITTDETESKDTEKEEDDNEETLQCPRCLASFGLDRQDDLITHIDKCVEQ